ncbi:MAG: flagellar basal body P-ring formation chaperone FlgA, partial [Planctomycetota bacterium]
GKPYRRVNTIWDVRVYQTLPVPGRAVVAGEVLSDSLFHTSRVLLNRGTSGTPLPLVALRGATAARNLTAGQPVTEQDIHRPVVVRSGEGLMVEVRKGAVSARVVGVAVGSGAVGDRIPVRLRDTGREMLARVSSSELAIVELGR